MKAHEFLEQGAEEMRDRAASRDQQNGERSMGRCVRAFNALTGHDLSETDGWLFMVILKAARAAGGAYRQDDWVDMAAYAALGGESAERICYGGQTDAELFGRIKAMPDEAVDVRDELYKRWGE